MAPPAITVIIPVHDRADLLERALASVTAQTGAPPFEVVVVDDASTDASVEVASREGARVVALSTNVGPGGARNAGIESAKGEWCAFLDSDDLWSPTHLRTLWQARAGVALIATSGLRVTASGGRVIGNPFLRPIEAHRPADMLRPESVMNTSATMVQTEVLRSLGGFPATRYAEDLDLWLRVLHDHEGRILPAITVGNWVHPSQTSLGNPTAMRGGLLDALAGAETGSAMSPTVRERLEAVAWWDDLRAEGHLPPAAEIVEHRRALPSLLLRRFVARHRWRVPGSGGRRVRTMLISGGAR